MRSVLAEVGLALAGRAGARLANVFGTRVSRNTVLRLVDALPEPQPQVPRVVGVDEYAMRKGRVYGDELVRELLVHRGDYHPVVDSWLAQAFADRFRPLRRPGHAHGRRRLAA
ncbi:hypothetical protein [Streptomyces mutabilis]|uniref:hypothetical protein n=1 Tax=Streptomyces mutabilis TaxID=67332 RepID=UPI000AF25CF1|nr:hypothetical protein [Streptomyces mutabilis]